MGLKSILSKNILIKNFLSWNSAPFPKSYDRENLPNLMPVLHSTDEIDSNNNKLG